MKPKFTFILTIIFGILIVGCKQKEQKVEVEEVKTDLVNDVFPESEEAIRKTMDSIAQSVMDGDIDRLISFHAYSPKFTEFKNGEPRNGGQENEEFERNVFGSVTEIVKFDMNDMKVAVFGDVANVTLHSDFHLKFGEDLAVVNEQISLLFVDTKDGWRIVHEHHSPLKKEESE
jgi:ketosteroid isomerase-like protein